MGAGSRWSLEHCTRHKDKCFGDWNIKDIEHFNHDEKEQFQQANMLTTKSLIEGCIKWMNGLLDIQGKSIND